MRFVLRIFAWLFALAAVIRGGLAVYTAWLAATVDTVGWDLTVESLMTDHVAALSWAPDFARNLLPNHMVEYVLGMQAIVATPLGALAAAALSWLFFRMSR